MRRLFYGLVIGFILGCAAAPLLSQSAPGVPPITARGAAYTRHIDIMPNSATLGPTAPLLASIGTARGLIFDADAQTVNLHIEIPNDWDRSTSPNLHISWVPQSGEPLLENETVIWLISYRSRGLTEVIDGGSVVATSATYTQTGGAGTDKQMIVTHIPIPATTGNQPVSAEDLLLIQFSRDMTNDTHGEDAIVMKWLFDYTSISAFTG
ncbi:hypothetical protein LCGC14_0987190 [marine sediment metagenome]|uniref:Uncharacterized protein n=2 Tax=root TaxID=1 RepID=A0A9C9TIR5_9HYPH|nr:hypothetical protein [Aurantimonas coralicida]